MSVCASHSESVEVRGKLVRVDSLYCVGAGHRTEVIRLGNKCLHPLRPLTRFLP